MFWRFTHLLIIALRLAACLVLGLLPSRSTSGQAPVPPQYVHESWTVEDGLPVNAVHALLQARDGYLWLGTADGLVRFDGVRFTVYDTGTAAGLPGSRIIQLAETYDGHLWMITEQHHLVRFAGGAFTTFGPESRLLHSKAYLFYEDRDAALWLATDRGLSRYVDGRFEPFAEVAFGGPVSCLLKDRAGVLWVGTQREGLLRFKDGTLTRFTERDGLASNGVHTLSEAPGGTLWVGTRRGITRYQDGMLTPFVLDGFSEEARVRSLYHDAAGTLYLGLPEGLYRREEDRLVQLGPTVYSGGELRALRDAAGHHWLAHGGRLYRDGQPVFTTAHDINSLLFDREGSLWIATATGGLHRLEPSLFTVYGKPEGLTCGKVYPVLEDRSGAIWLGTRYGGLARIDSRVTTFPRTPLGRTVSAIHETQAGDLWIAGHTGVCRLEGDTCAEAALPEVRVRAIYEDRQGRLWFGTEEGLYRYRAGGGPWLRYTTEDGLSHNHVRALHQTRDGTLWLATNGGGLTAYRDGRFTPFTAAAGLCSNFIRSMYQDEDGLLWVGTEDRGLCRLDLRGTSALQDAAVTAYRMRDGLFDKAIHQILEDSHGRLWMSTNRGLFWVRRSELNAFAAGERKRIYSVGYTERDGMRSREASGGVQPAGIQARDGRLWFPTQDGVVVVDPEAAGIEAAAPPVAVEGVVLGDTMLVGAAVALPAHQRSFRIDYTGLSFLAPEKMQFRYRLEGFDGDWVVAGTRRQAAYTNIPPGNYVFRVAATASGSAWSEQEATLALTVAPFFYETAWFQVLYVLGLVLFAAFGFWGHLRHVKAREQALRRLIATRTAEVEQQKAQIEAQAHQLRELDEAKSRFFANISHEFRTPLTLIISPLQHMLAGGYGTLPPALHEPFEMMLRNSQRLLRLIGQILDLARLEAGVQPLQARRGDLMPFVQRTVRAFAPLAERQHLALRCRTASGPCPVSFDPEQLEQVLANLLSNAIKFTPPGGRVSVACRKDLSRGCAEIVVEDTGVGMPAEALPHIFDRFYQVESSATRKWEGTGIGLALTRELVERHGGAIEVESEPARGSIFRVRLPLCEEAEAGAPCRSVVPAEPGPSGGDGIWRGSDGAAGYGTADLLQVAPSAPAREAPPAGGCGPADAADRTTVLVVDDNADVRAYVRSILAPWYRVIEASDGAQGLEQAREALPDLIVADVMMPHVDGFALSRALKEEAATEGIPVILLTARAAAADQVEGLQTGADDYVTKPFLAEVLLAKVRNLIALRQRLRERLRQELAGQLGLPRTPASDLEAEVRRVIQEHLLEEAFSVEALAAEVALSASQLRRRLREEAGLSPQELIRRVRVEEAARLLREGAGTVSEVGYAVGFNGLSHFARCFREHFGVTPSAYAEQVRALS